MDPTVNNSDHLVFLYLIALGIAVLINSVLLRVLVNFFEKFDISWSRAVGTTFLAIIISFIVRFLYVTAMVILGINQWFAGFTAIFLSTIVTGWVIGLLISAPDGLQIGLGKGTKVALFLLILDISLAFGFMVVTMIIVFAVGGSDLLQNLSSY